MKKKTLILGVDFKDNTVKLCAEAVKYAAKLKSTITLVHAVEYIPYYPYFPHEEEHVKDFLECDIQYKLDQIESYIKLYNVEVSGRIVERGKTYEVLCQKADELDASAIIVGVGQHYLFEELIGSTTEKVCRMAKQKVIILNDKNEKPVCKILCAFDFSENSFASLASAARFAHHFKADLKIMHVYDSHENPSEITEHIKKLSAKVIKNELEVQAEGSSINYEVILKQGVSVIEILKSVKEYDIDLLSIGASGHNQFTRLFLGSTVAKIIRKAPCAIVVSPKTA